MGMSASQARLLSLLARMSDVEYEGQQINQQRLVLSNKMNEVMERMTNMDVPTPPSKQDFLYNEYSGKTRTGKKISATMNDDGTFNITKQVQGNIVEDAGLQNVTYGSTIQGNPIDNIFTSRFMSTDSDGYHVCGTNEEAKAHVSETVIKGRTDSFAFNEYKPSDFHRYYSPENPLEFKSTEPYKGLDSNGVECAPRSYADTEDTYIEVPNLKYVQDSPAGLYNGGKYYGTDKGSLNQEVYVYNGSEVSYADLREQTSYEEDGETKYRPDSELKQYLRYKNVPQSFEGAAQQPEYTSTKISCQDLVANGHYEQDGTTRIALTFPMEKEEFDKILEECSTKFADLLSGKIASANVNGTEIPVSGRDNPENSAVCSADIAAATGASAANMISVENIVSEFWYTKFEGIDAQPAASFDSDAEYSKDKNCKLGDPAGNKIYTGKKILSHNNDVQNNLGKTYYTKTSDGKFKKYTGDLTKCTVDVYAEVESGGTGITDQSLDPEKITGFYVYDPSTKNAKLVGEGVTAEEAIAGLLSGKYRLMEKSSSGSESFNDASNLDNLTVNGRKTMSVAEAKEKYGSSELDDALCGLKNTLDKKDGTFNEDDYTVIVNVSEGGKVTFSFCLTNDLLTGSGLATDGDRGEGRVFNAAHGSYEETIENLDVSYDENGFLEDVILPNGEIVHMEITQKVDEIEYDAAMNKYEIAKIVYDKEVNELNKQTSIYQRQDKQLELKLTRLDTERNALNTEIDAVKKVIQDATEKGFKTFSG